MANGKKNILGTMDYSEFLPQGGYRIDKASSTDVAPVQKKKPLTGLDNIRDFYAGNMAGKTLGSSQQQGSISPTVEKNVPEQLVNQFQKLPHGAQNLLELTTLPSMTRLAKEGRQFVKEPSWGGALNVGLNTLGSIPGAGIGFKGLKSAFSKGFRKVPEVVNDVVPQKMLSAAPQVAKKQPWQMEEMPGLHLKSMMSDNPKGLHNTVAKDGTINTKNALNSIKKNEGQAKHDVVKEMFGDNIPDNMDYNEFRKTIQGGLWDVGTGKGPKVDMYSGMDMKKFGIIKNDKAAFAGHKPTSLGYDKDEVVLEGYSFANKDKFIGGSTAHSMPKETLGHSRGFTNPKEPGVYYSAERQSNWAQEAGSTLRDTDIELLQRQQKTLIKGIKEQDRLIAAGNDSWAVTQKGTFQSQLKGVSEQIDSYNRYSNASPQEKLVMKNMHQRMLQEDVANAASKGHTKYRMPSEETTAKIQGYDKIYSNKARIKSEKLKLEIINNPKGYKEKWGITEQDPDEHFNKVMREFNENPEAYVKNANEKINTYEKALKEEGDFHFSQGQKTIIKQTSQSIKDAEKLFGTKLKPITDAKGNTWYELDIPKKFKEGKGEIKAFTTAGAAIGAGSLYEGMKGKENKIPYSKYKN